ncbi:flagellar hook assembly protein FlgD [Aquabacterium sp. A7-Y]|uniref:flagellar hook assembly protein FlgD n=1 Tax=Aquabacterium sp. A7-Y TaxID=1349605 RepID=UPI00223D0B99|nr:flagellar hook assembly protein FlgD [Aquabacterium sp. A7-Y]MCW7540513.1 flagellar hook assembly protein FlgD [Aquabacterium sp. A7-Y]
MTSSVSNTTTNANSLYGSTSTPAQDPSAQDRFLKLLVTQMQNQDPLNPMDNAQVTSQMAQIQTVSGIEKLNSSLATMGASFTQGQAMQAASLIGRDVLIEGNTMAIADDEGRAAFELAGKASRVTVEVTDAAGQVIDTVELGAMNAGRHHFLWAPEDGTDQTAVRFKVSASSGGSAVPATSYSRETVGAVSTTAQGVELDLTNGTTVAYGKVAGVVSH